MTPPGVHGEPLGIAPFHTQSSEDRPGVVLMARLDDLEALRDLLWTSLTVAEPEKRGPLAAQYRGTLAEIAELSKDTEKAGDSIDEIAARRAARGGATSRLGQAAGRPS